MTKFIPFILCTALSLLSFSSLAEDGEIVLKSTFAQATPERATTMKRMKKGPTIQQMMRKLQPKKKMMARAGTATSGAQSYKAAGDNSQGYEVVDCTDSNGNPQACCSFTPGGGGSTCDVFMALCDQMEGTTSSGNSNGAVCAGEGTVE